MSVRAKFWVSSIQAEDGGKKIELAPVYDSNPDSENGKFFKHTPAGYISISTVNEDAAAQFKVGEEYYVDFTPVKADGG